MENTTGRVGLLGWPVEHSVSPAMHNAAFAALGLDAWQYDLLPVPPEALAERITALLAEGVVGFNVTVPHKAAVLDLPQVRAVDADVQAMRAANTLIRTSDGSLRAANTDWRGFRDDLLAEGIDPAGGACLILGTGGSAQAAAYALRRMGASTVSFVSRHPADRADTIGYDALPGEGVALIVNCTPVGMWPAVDASPWPDGSPLPADAALVDLIYNPSVTRLMARARADGLHATGGLGMLVRQGALSFEMWTGRQAPLDVMTAAARRALRERESPEQARRTDVE